MSVGTLRSRETRKKPMASKQMNWRFLPVLAALAACVPPPVAAQTVVKIGVVNSFSGFLAGPGDEMQKGIDLYAKEHMKDLPAGVTIEVVKRDDAPALRSASASPRNSSRATR
jgi:ABC-type branched-subunit amino acid transport system substrate-binding protein